MHGKLDQFYLQWIFWQLEFLFLELLEHLSDGCKVLNPILHRKSYQQEDYLLHQ